MSEETTQITTINSESIAKFESLVIPNRITDYNGELDDIDPVEYGFWQRCKTEGLKAKFDEFEINPAWYYHAPSSSIESEYLDRWSEKMCDSWFKEHHRRHKVDFEHKVALFKVQLSEFNIGDTVYIEFHTNRGNYFKHQLVYVTDSGESAAFIDDDEYIRVCGRSDNLSNLYKDEPK